MKNSLPKTLVAATVAAIMWTSQAHAVAILTPGNNPQTDENVLLNSGLTGTVIFGTTNQTGTSVRFTGTEPITAPANGQARIEAVDMSLTSLVIDVPNGTFSSLILNPDASVTGTADFTVTTTVGAPQLFNNVALGGSGSNFLTFTTSTAAERFVSVGVVTDSPLVFTDVAQVRLGGAQRNTAVPDGGATIAMLGMALVGLFGLRRRLNS